jgi:hypothetical protein
MRRTMLTPVVVMAAGVGLWLAQADDPKDNPRTKLMKQKLVHAQKLLEGLAIQDFTILERNSDDLGMLSKKAEWQVVATPEYARYSEDLRRHCADIAAAAKKKNIDLATLGYLKLTTTCVECHKHLRETKIARLEAGAMKLPAAP